MHTNMMKALASDEKRLCSRIGRRTIPVVFSFNDFPTILKPLGLPMFSMCSTARTKEIAVPDFTFHSYGKIRGFTSTSWPFVAQKLFDTNVDWFQRNKTLFWRGCISGSHVRRHFIKRLTTQNNKIQNVDALDTGFFGSNKKNYQRLTDQCKYAFLLHLDGNAYSASLKYKLACASLVFVKRSPYYEFFYPGLIDGVHVVFIADVADLKQKLRYYSNSGFLQAQTIGKNAREFARTQLSQTALACYWNRLFTKYIDIFANGSHDESSFRMPESDQGF